MPWLATQSAIQLAARKEKSRNAAERGWEQQRQLQRGFSTLQSFQKLPACSDEAAVKYSGGGQSFVFRESLNTQISQFHFSILSIYNFLKTGLLKRGNKLELSGILHHLRVAH